MIQYKTFKFNVETATDNESEGKIVGYASTFGNVDLGLDVVNRGAFKKTLQESRGIVPILADHDPTKQIGWNEEAKEDSKGLYVKGALDLNVSTAKERYSLAKKALKLGAPMGLSIGYITIKAEPDLDNPRIRKLTELKLLEYSLVTFPMNTQAMVTAAKSIGAIDKVRFLLKHLEEEGISLKDLELTLREEAVKKDEDPTLIGQSIDDLIEKFRS